MIIAIDGPSASGKGTLGRALAHKLGYHYLDTGALYRMVGLSVQRRGLDPTDQESAAAIAASLDPSSFQDSELRGEGVGSYASKIAALPKVRAALLKLQRDFAQKKPGTVLDGRDIGTVVCPDADFKFFVTASVEARAGRRLREHPTSDLAAITADIKARDERDSNRAVAPLKPAEDSILIDNSELTPDEALQAVLGAIELY
ncbi:(d)CMP kinase [Aestuariivirga litoralis]|uniref:(d)CMP kinase n=1 Tax=Aestuariivirga litoralis TaxID=2650924 RepID=UPI0018C4CA79|nr:(d)CMP kinase [Aestuariivirga litoralis]